MSSVSKWVRAGVLILIAIGLADRASAATRIWTGLGADAATTTVANWSGNAPPQDGDDVIFPAGAAQLTVIQLLTVNFHSITFATTGGAVYHVIGPINIVDHIEVDSGEADLSGGAIVLLQSGNTAADITFSALAGSELVLSGSLTGPELARLHIVGPGRVTFAESGGYFGPTMIDSGTLRVQSDTGLGSQFGEQAYINPGATLELDDANGTINHPIQCSDGTTMLVTSSTTLSTFITFMGHTQITVAGGQNLIFSGLVSGDGTFSKDGLGDVRFAGTVDNTFGQVSGAAIITAGTMHLSQALATQGHVALPAGLEIDPGAQVRYQADNQIEGQVTINSGGHLLVQGFVDTIQSLDGPSGGTVDMTGGTLTVGNGQFSGAITGTGSLVVSGGSSVKLNGASTFTGTTTVTSENLIVNGTLPGPIVLAGGTLLGTGTVGTVTSNNGIVSPGVQGGGTLHTQSFALTSGAYAVNAFPVSGNAAFASTAVIGTVTLGGLLDHSGFTPGIVVPSSPIVIIDNDGTDPVAGTFTGLPEGASFVQNGIAYTISYHGGDGNDVVLFASPSTAPPPATYYLSEGSTGGFFATDILIANPNSADAPVTMTFYTQSNGVVTKNLTVPAMQRITVTLNSVSAIGDGAVSTIVSSDSGVPLIVERTMTWDRSGYGSSGDKAVSGPSTTWYFAEGSQGFFSTYLLLANPQTTANTATVTYFREGDVPLTRTYPLAPQSRSTIDLGTDASLINRSFGMQVQFAQPGVAERSMYFGKSPLWSGGHESAGVTAPSADWLLAEGATGPFFETFILLANPNSTDAQATVTFLPAGGAPVVKTKTVPANGRLTINIEPEDPALANAAVATQVHATLPIVVERSQYWPDPAPQWYEAHNSFGVTSPGTKWGLAEGRVGQTVMYQSYILLANPGSTPANVTIQFLRENGGATLTKTFTVPPTTRRNIAIAGAGSDVPELVDENFGAIISSDQPIAVERSMYANAIGQIWAAGTNATGSPLP